MRMRRVAGVDGLIGVIWSGVATIAAVAARTDHISLRHVPRTSVRSCVGLSACRDPTFCHPAVVLWLRPRHRAAVCVPVRVGHDTRKSPSMDKTGDVVGRRRQALAAAGAVTVSVMAVSGATAGASSASSGAVTGPSSSQSPYVVGSQPGVVTKSILTVGDSVNLKPDGTPYRMVGIPDGLGGWCLSRRVGPADAGSADRESHGCGSRSGGAG